jgi:hypothetical protein
MGNRRCFNRKHAQCPWVVSRPTRVRSTRYLPRRVRICDLTTCSQTGNPTQQTRGAVRASPRTAEQTRPAPRHSPRRSPHVDCLRDSSVRSTREGQRPAICAWDRTAGEGGEACGSRLGLGASVLKPTTAPDVVELRCACCAGRSGGRSALVRNFVVPAPKELHETEPVAEWINHQCQPTPVVSRDCALEASARIHSLPDG